jgi:hypothetical protein
MEDYRSRRYTPDEVSAIVRRALDARVTADTVSYDDLVETAAELNISPERLRMAVESEQEEGKRDLARKKVIQHRRDEFRGHFLAYCIVNGGLLLVNLVTSPSTFWVVWPVIGWGIGLAFHASDTFFPSESDLEKSVRRYLKKQEPHRKHRRRHEPAI